MKETNIILVNLTPDTLAKILKLCADEKIHYTFDKDYYSEEYYDLYSLLDSLVLSNQKIPSIYKELIENQYKDFVEDVGDEYLNGTEILQKIDSIVYEN